MVVCQGLEGVFFNFFILDAGARRAGRIVNSFLVENFYVGKR